MVVSGVPDRKVDHAERLMEFGIEMLKALQDFNSEFGYDLRIRVGINSGAVVGGKIYINTCSIC